MMLVFKSTHVHTSNFLRNFYRD